MTGIRRTGRSWTGRQPPLTPNEKKEAVGSGRIGEVQSVFAAAFAEADPGGNRKTLGGRTQHGLTLAKRTWCQGDARTSDENEAFARKAAGGPQANPASQPAKMARANSAARAIIARTGRRVAQPRASARGKAVQRLPRLLASAPRIFSRHREEDQHRHVALLQTKMHPLREFTATEKESVEYLEPIRKPSEERGTGTFCSEDSAK